MTFRQMVCKTCLLLQILFSQQLMCTQKFKKVSCSLINWKFLWLGHLWVEELNFCCKFGKLFSVVVYLNRNCRCAPILDVSLVRKLPEKFGPGTLHHILRETVQQIVNCAVDTSFVFNKVDPGNLRILSITGKIFLHLITHISSWPNRNRKRKNWKLKKGKPLWN